MKILEYYKTKATSNSIAINRAVRIIFILVNFSAQVYELHLQLTWNCGKD